MRVHEVVVIVAVGVDEGGHDVDVGECCGSKGRDPETFDEVVELGCAEVEQPEGGIDGQVVVQHPQPVRLAERGVRWSASRRPEGRRP